ncbi:hypothetical protein V6Z12_D01G175300 [Gossypium hirsutum]
MERLQRSFSYFCYYLLRDKGIKALLILMAAEGVTMRMQKELGMM